MDCFARARNDDVTRVSLYAVWYYLRHQALGICFNEQYAIK